MNTTANFDNMTDAELAAFRTMTAEERIADRARRHGLTLPIISTERFERTYLGARTIITITHHDDSKLGLRTTQRHFLDSYTNEGEHHRAGDITETLIKGDGRLASFEILIPEHTVATA